MQLKRLLLHLTWTHWAARRRFGPPVLTCIEQEIRAAESRHAGQIRFAIESALDLQHLWANLSPRQRALQVFAQLGIWDTAANNGVLIYVLLADHDVEIVADRGISARVEQAEWDEICHLMEQHFRAGRFLEGSRAGVHAVGELLARHFPGEGAAVDELPDRPVLL